MEVIFTPKSPIFTHPIKHKNLFALVLLAFISLSLTAQNITWQWVQTAGGIGRPGATSANPARDEIKTYAFDKEGNLIVGGRISWYPDFDTIHFGSSVNWDNDNLFLAKYDNCGNILWATVGGGANPDFISGLDIDDEGNIYTHGYLQAQGGSATIKSPSGDTTFTSPMIYQFSKFDKNGNFIYGKSSNVSFGLIDNAFKRLKNGTFLTYYLNGSTTPITIDGYTIPARGRAFIILDSLGYVTKGALIDSLNNTVNALLRFVLDENENIYFTVVNLSLPSISILSTVLNPAPQTTLCLVKTDTSFLVKDINTTGYRNDAIGYLSYSNGYLYAAGRCLNGGIFDYDTTYTTYSSGYYSTYKIDTNLNLVWASKPDVQTLNPTFTYFLPGAGKDYLYLGYQNRGTVTWDSVTLTTAGNTYHLAVLKLRTSDGVCVDGLFTGGVNDSKDEVQFLGVDPQATA